MRGTGRSLRAAALLSLGAFALHQIRFVLGYGHQASEALAVQGHSYMPLVEALIAVFLGAASIRFAHSLFMARRGSPVDVTGPPFSRLWAFCSSALLAVYTLQEGFEGEFSAGHPTGLVGVFGHGGWTALPLALAIGALIALVLEGARRVIVLVGSRVRRTRGRPRTSRPKRLPAIFARLDVIAQNLAARGPPIPS
jgi:hypothetical protein